MFLGEMKTLNYLINLIRGRMIKMLGAGAWGRNSKFHRGTVFWKSTNFTVRNFINSNNETGTFTGAAFIGLFFLCKS